MNFAFYPRISYEKVYSGSLGQSGSKRKVTHFFCEFKGKIKEFGEWVTGSAERYTPKKSFSVFEAFHE
jgi:hypothetical protein